MRRSPLPNYILADFHKCQPILKPRTIGIKKAAELDAQYLSLLTLPNLLSPEAQTREDLEMLEAQLKSNAEAGDAAFQYELGLLYERQPLLDPDATQAIDWFEKAAAQQHPDADYHLGALYWHDKRVTSDFAKARQYFEKAAANGDELAKEHLGNMLLAGQGGPKRCSSCRGFAQRTSRRQ